MITKLKIFEENILVPRNIEGRKDKIRQNTLALKDKLIKDLANEVYDGDLILETDIESEIEIELLGDFSFINPSDVKLKTITGSLIIFGTNMNELPIWLKGVTVNGELNCTHNAITFIKNMPIVKQRIVLDWNNIKSLEGLPERINGDLSVQGNLLKSLNGCPKYINGDFDCSDNYVIFDNPPKGVIINGDFIN